MIVVTDTSPLCYLILIREIQILPALFGTVQAPEAVIEELQHPGTPQLISDWSPDPPSKSSGREKSKSSTSAYSSDR